MSPMPRWHAQRGMGSRALVATVGVQFHHLPSIAPWETSGTFAYTFGVRSRGPLPLSLSRHLPPGRLTERYGWSCQAAARVSIESR